MSLPENVSVILSGYPSQLYDNTLTGWRTREFQAMTRGGVRTEKIWMNYQEGRAYSHTFARKDYNDRYRIKRKGEALEGKIRCVTICRKAGDHGGAQRGRCRVSKSRGWRLFR